ncbi:aldehyde dehydrogenase family protein, partial [Edaphobacter sp. HDX4]|uniref:aldehyde dehydrogenase family protein n=1 Tax=Edaphobacter sp. HDX4 TaxID=2794064 RepID=UPI003AC46FCA
MDIFAIQARSGHEIFSRAWRRCPRYRGPFCRYRYDHRTLVKGGYYHAGQVCVSTQRIFIQEDIKEDFIARFARRVETLEVGDPTLYETDVGPLILP